MSLEVRHGWKQPVNTYYLYFGSFGLENVSSLNKSNCPNGKGWGKVFRNVQTTSEHEGHFTWGSWSSLQEVQRHVRPELCSLAQPHIPCSVFPFAKWETGFFPI